MGSGATADLQAALAELRADAAWSACAMRVWAARTGDTALAEEAEGRVAALLG